MSGLDINWLAQFGPAGLVGLLFCLAMRMNKDERTEQLKTHKAHIDAQLLVQKDILNAAAEERASWLRVMSALREDLVAHTQYARSEIESFKQVDKFQREEHLILIERHNKGSEQRQKQLDALERIIGVVVQCKNNLEEQGKVLLRINGAKQ